MKILVVSCDPALREMLLTVATGLNFQPASAVGFAEAPALYDRERASLVVIDVEPTRQPGTDLCRHVRDADPKRETFLLALTSDGSQGDLQALLDLGVDDYLIKPATPDDIRARLLIAEQRIARESLRRAAEDGLARARWLAGIGETSIALQHEINNPLTALLGHAELMLLDAGPDGPDTERLRVIHEQARRIADVVRRLGRLRDPQTVEYAAGARMIDLSDQRKGGL